MRKIAQVFDILLCYPHPTARFNLQQRRRRRRHSNKSPTSRGKLLVSMELLNKYETVEELCFAISRRFTSRTRTDTKLLLFRLLLFSQEADFRAVSNRRNVGSSITIIICSLSFGCGVEGWGRRATGKQSYIAVKLWMFY